MELNNFEQNGMQNNNVNNLSDSVDNFEPSHVNVTNIPENPNTGMGNINMEQVKKAKKDKKGNETLGIFALILAIIALALTGYLYTEFIKQNKKLDKLNAEINKTTKTLENINRDIDKKIEDFKKEANKKANEEEKEKEKNSRNKANYMKVAENVLNEVGRDYKKDQKQFQDDKGVLDQKAFENKFLRNNEITKMKTDGNWKIETEGATIRYNYEYNLEKDKENNFRVELTLKSEGDFEVKSFKMPKENSTETKPNTASFDK